MSVDNRHARFPWTRQRRIVTSTDDSIPEFEYVLAPFDAETRPIAKDLAFLHSTLLPTSPASKLGMDFLTSFYYSNLVEDGHIFGCIAYIDGKPVALWTGTENSNGFMRIALRRHFIRLTMILVWSLLKDPRRIAGMIEALQLMRVRKHSDELIGETLSLGILPAFRSRDFKGPTGVQISQDISNTGQAEFCRRNVPLIRMVVDQANVRNQAFSEGRGWKRTESSVDGWKTPSYEYRACPEDLFPH